MPAASSSAQGQKLTSQSNPEFKNSENMDHLVKEIAENLKLAETAASAVADAHRAGGHSTLGDPWDHDLVDPYGPSGNAVNSFKLKSSFGNLLILYRSCNDAKPEIPNLKVIS